MDDTVHPHVSVKTRSHVIISPAAVTVPKVTPVIRAPSFVRQEHSAKIVLNGATVALTLTVIRSLENVSANRAMPESTALKVFFTVLSLMFWF